MCGSFILLADVEFYSLVLNQKSNNTIIIIV